MEMLTVKCLLLPLQQLMLKKRPYSAESPSQEVLTRKRDYSFLKYKEREKQMVKELNGSRLFCRCRQPEIGMMIHITIGFMI